MTRILTLIQLLIAPFSGVLFETLREACTREPQISERFGVEVDELDQFNSGVTLRDATGKALESQPYDLVVEAFQQHDHSKDGNFFALHSLPHASICV